MSEGPHNSLNKLYTDALSRIEKREKVALSKAVVSLGSGGSVPAPYQRQEIRAFYNKLKEGLNDDYCEVLSCFQQPGSKGDAARTIQYLARTKAPRGKKDQRVGGYTA